MTRIINSLDDVSANYDVYFVDLWGCVHNGIESYRDAVAALKRRRADGSVVILVTNSPRPKHGILDQLKQLGVPDECWDDIATSGDSARAAMFRGAVGEKVWFIGEQHDQTFFDPMTIIDDPAEITKVPLEDAEGIVCCGPFDPHEDPEKMRPQLLMAKQKGLKLLCANPDIIVDRGEAREWCAGAIAKLYTEMGGESLYFGKPHPPIYDLARREVLALGHDIEDQRILVIGDGILTDVAGGIGEDIDSLFITGGLARNETKTTEQPDAQALTQYLEAQKLHPSFAIGFLR